MNSQTQCYSVGRKGAFKSCSVLSVSDCSRNFHVKMRERKRLVALRRHRHNTN